MNTTDNKKHLGQSLIMGALFALSSVGILVFVALQSGQ